MLAKKHTTFVLNMRMDIRDFASLVSAYHSALPPGTAIGSYARVGLEDYIEMLRKAGSAQSFSTAEAANVYLTDAGLRQQTRSVRVARALLGELENTEVATQAVKDALDKRAETSLNQTIAKTKASPDEILAMLESEAREESEGDDA
jgi:hypothetical protein